MNLKNGWVLRVDDDVWKYLDRIPRNDTKRIVAEMDKLTENPFGDDSKKMRGEDALWRRRVGSYRILYQILTEEKIVWIPRVARRTSNTY
jgi:mRNA interferase RelE/StbE